MSPLKLLKQFSCIPNFGGMVHCLLFLFQNVCDEPYLHQNDRKANKKWGMKFKKNFSFESKNSLLAKVDRNDVNIAPYW